MQLNQVNIFEKFIEEYEQYSVDATLPTTADQDVRYALQLQEKRLRDKGYSIRYHYEPRGIFKDGGYASIHWSDEVYDNYQQYRTCSLTKTIYKNGRKVYRKKQNEIFYQVITNSVHPQPPEDELYVCPNCGGVVRIRELEEGCPYCGTQFDAGELFPKVSNFFHIRDHGKTNTEIKTGMKNIILPCILIAMIGMFIYELTQHDSLLQTILMTIIPGIIYGCLVGYLLYGIKLIGGLFLDAGRALRPVAEAAGSKKKFTDFMRQFSPDFSYEFFTSKVCSMIKTIVFSDSEKQVPFYCGRPLDPSYRNILEANMAGNAAIRSFQVNKNYVYLTVTMYMDNIYPTGYGVRSKRESFAINLCRNISRPVNYNFSIHKITCKACSGSFDASRQVNCPYCGNPYPIQDEDWVITAIQKF